MRFDLSLALIPFFCVLSTVINVKIFSCCVTLQGQGWAAEGMCPTHRGVKPLARPMVDSFFRQGCTHMGWLLQGGVLHAMPGTGCDCHPHH